MEITVILFATIVILACAYRFYSPCIAQKLGLRDDRPTPDHTMGDGVDYCPAKMPVLFGHHFASIAGAAPIVGPVIAAAYGWLPVILWILVGGVFLGAVHDFATLVASVRHSGRSIGEVIHQHVGLLGSRLFLFFLWATLVLLVACFLAVVAKTFATVPSAATASCLFIGLAVIFGVSIYRLCLSLGWMTLVGVGALTMCMVAGWYWPLKLSADMWLIVLIVYIVVASVTPVWILLQPRDYLNSFLLYALLLISVIGIFAARPSTAYPAFITWVDPKLGSLFPILFVTVACGAISGFHSVVASGTTAKQLNRERDARPIGFGAMLVESLLAAIALITVMKLSRPSYAFNVLAKGPVDIFSSGVGSFLGSLGLDDAHGRNFAALAVSAFALTTLDTATRLCRYAFQEFFSPHPGKKPSALATNRFIGTGITVAAAAALAFSGQWKLIWPIFGAANQLLAALALLAVTLWLRHKGMKSGFLRIPLFVMFAITLSALVEIAYRNIAGGNYTLGGIGAALLVLAGTLVVESVRSLTRNRSAA
jgi:carbon starvation protein